MKKTIIALIAAGALAVVGVAGAYLSSQSPARAASPSEERVQTFAIQNMTCALCPITVKKAMSGVDGVVSVDVDFDAKTATVIYKPSIASADEIADASTNAGYPATAI